MRNWAAIKERYLRDSLPIRLGGLAANLLRIKSFSDHPDHRDVIESLLDESKFFIEWTAPETGIDLQVELVALQLQLACWQRSWQAIWADPLQRVVVGEQAQTWSERVLKRSGLLGR